MHALISIEQRIIIIEPKQRELEIGFLLKRKKNPIKILQIFLNLIEICRIFESKKKKCG